MQTGSPGLVMRSYMQGYRIRGNETSYIFKAALQNGYNVEAAANPQGHLSKKNRFHPRPSFSPRFVCFFDYEVFSVSQITLQMWNNY